MKFMPLPTNLSRRGPAWGPRAKAASLELELDAEAQGRRELEDCARAEERVIDRRDARRAGVNLERRVLTDGPLRVRHVEPVELEPQLAVLTDLNRVVGAEVEVPSRGRAVAARQGVDGRAARDGEALVVAVDGGRDQLVERDARLRAERGAQEQLERRAVGAVNLELVRAVVRQTPVGVLEQADEVEERRDVRVALAVVVAEQALVVTDQARIHVGRDELPVVGEALRRRDLERAVVAARAAEAADARSGARDVFGRLAVTSAARIEDEVGVAVVERAVLDDVALRAVDAAEAEREVL